MKERKTADRKRKTEKEKIKEKQINKMKQASPMKGKSKIIHKEFDFSSNQKCKKRFVKFVFKNVKKIEKKN